MKIRPFYLISIVLIISSNNAFAQLYKTSNHYSIQSQKFSNPTTKESNKGFLQFLRWKLLTTSQTWPTWIETKNTPSLNSPSKKQQANITFVNHSTFLIQYDNINILTDPVWSERVSPLSWIGPKRVHKPGIKFENLPPIHIVLISHNHYDHLDSETLIRLDKEFSPIFLCPLGDKALLTSLGLKNIFELDWWENLAFNDLEIYFTPSQHWSGRGIFDRFESLWGSYTLLYQNKKIHFGGDTGYSTHFKSIKKRFGSMDLSLLPIGAYAPRWFMQTTHMDPEESIWAHQDLMSAQSIGMHFGSFQLTNESREEPVYKLRMHLRANSIDLEKFITLKPGESRLFDL